ncbi:MAG: phosphatase PAP2 family protein, partial [Clostridiales bacterium]|nr:phosphatase PAP2 family protein [Clostridiales bacterium]
MTICYMVYTIWPNQQDLRPQEVLGNDIFARAVRFIYWFDTPTNVCPSMHVMDAIGVNMAILHCKKLKKHHLIQIGSTILAILICASTLFVKQHSVVDVFWGIVLSIILYIPIY